MKNIYLLKSCLYLLAICILSSSASAQNLLLNGGFENGHSGWGGAGEISGTAVFEGEKSLHFNFGMADQVIYDLDTSLTYKVSAWIFITNQFTGDDWGGINLSVLTYNWQDVVQIAAITPYNHPVEQWFQVIATYKTTSDAIRVQVGMFGGQGWNADFYVDDVRCFIKPSQNNPPHFENIQLNAASGSAPFHLTGQITGGDDFFGSVVQTHLDFGDGGISSGFNIDYTYYSAGQFPFKIIIIDDEGATCDSTIVIDVAGNPDVFIHILQPTVLPEFHTNSSAINISGERSGLQGQAFWINTRTQQSGFVAASDEFSVTNISLLPGENPIQVQSCDNIGGCLTNELTVFYDIPGYSGPVISNLHTTTNQVGQFQKWECTFDVQTVADNLWFPYDSEMPANTFSGKGITIDAIFTNGIKSKKVPAFYDIITENLDGKIRPAGDFTWRVRMSFDEPGIWQMTLKATDEAGTKEFPCAGISVIENDQNPGFIKVSENDNRYFEFSNGTPFVGMGHGIGMPDNSLEIDDNLDRFASNGINFSRIWLMEQSPFSDAWCSWATHHPMENNGYMPPPLYTIAQHYKQGDFSLRLAAPAIENQNTPAMFRGFWDVKTAIKPSTPYRITARVKTLEIAGNGGLVMKTGGWLGEEAIEPGVGNVISNYLKGSQNWVYLIGNYVSEPWETTFPNFYIVLEDVVSGEAFIDEVTIQEVRADGSLSGNILTKSSANAHYYLDPIECRYFDFLIEKASEQNVYLKIPILEKNDWMLNHIEPLTGLVTENNGNFAPPAGSKLHRLYEYYWRYLIARWGYATSVHSWELLNEGAPGSYFNLMDDMADFFDKNSPYPRMTSTSFWSEWVPDYWKNSKADYSDIHAYIMTTGWIDEYEIDGVSYSRQDLKDDAAAAVYAYSDYVWRDPLRNKPVILAETDLDQPGTQTPDPLLAYDTAGIWLHNFNWGHINHGGQTAFIWNNSNIINNNLFYRYKSFRAFMKEIPLNNGQFVPLSKTVTNQELRVWGQQQTTGKAAHFWVQNKNHTWKKVLENGNPIPESGQIILSGIKPGEVTIEMWDSWAEATSPTEIVSQVVGTDSTLTIIISNLVTDIAFKVKSAENQVVQNIPLNAGWRGISSWVEPENNNLATLLQPIIPDFEIIMGNEGIFWPDGQVFTLSEWNPKTGYFIKMNQPSVLSIAGQPVADKSIILPAGWSILPVLSNCQQVLSELFGNDISKIKIIKSVAGTEIFWPEFQIFSLNQLQPGFSYFVKTDEEIIVHFIDCK